MIGLNVRIPYFASGVLDAALRSVLHEKLIGISDYGRDRPSTIWLSESATADEQAQALAVIQAHDPVSISLDKTAIAANGIDAVTVTLSVLRPDAAPVALVITQPGGAQLTQAIDLVNGIGTLALTATIPGTYAIALQNPANRSIETLRVTAS